MNVEELRIAATDCEDEVLQNRLMDAADEIERLETERNDWQKIAQDQIDRNAHQQATLMVMRAALVSADKAINPEDRGGISLAEWNERLKVATENIRQALATDTGKSAADVLAAADLLERAEYEMRSGPERTDMVRAKKIKLRDAVRTYRKEGRDDGAPKAGRVLYADEEMDDADLDRDHG